MLAQACSLRHLGACCLHLGEDEVENKTPFVVHIVLGWLGQCGLEELCGGVEQLPIMGIVHGLVEGAALGHGGTRSEVVSRWRIRCSLRSLVLGVIACCRGRSFFLLLGVIACSGRSFFLRAVIGICILC